MNGNSLTFNYATESITASRTWIEGGFKHVDDLALKSDIEPGISEDEARTLIQSYDYVTNASLENRGFRTYDQVESQITAKGYRTEQQIESQIDSQIEAKGYVTEQQVESQVESQITAKGYVTESRAAEIAAGTLPEGYAQDEVVGTLEDGSEVRFYILTKAVS